MHVCVSRCVLCTLPAVPGAVRHPSVSPGDLAGTVHQPGRGQRLEDYLPIIWRYTYVITVCRQYTISGCNMGCLLCCIFSYY